MIKKENHVRIIFHIDMNAYFCSVACILYPSLRGEAFAIGRENTYNSIIISEIEGRFGHSQVNK